ncbi:DUF397 domain-containing protein [Streptomyces aidingensis]|uniref:DUF397 domain-containing protein n=1 Tax=Streptomyces aidingensis TaxID=910347 RepID=A0A1I1SHE2_9ACTN|nr:DUF397 domain-containing protein [Streptomyces aidingensis]SFD43263.1 protein of unknown function [Streptomyces aidingensis]
MNPTTEIQWRKSSYSGESNGACLEVQDGHPGVVPVRDSKAPHMGHLIFSGDSWQPFVTSLKS